MTAKSALKLSSVVVTGANRGLGLEIVKQMCALPSPPKTLIATARNPSDAKELLTLANNVKQTHVVVLKLDMADSGSFDKFASEVRSHFDENGLTLLLNNAGIIGKRGSLETVTAEQMAEVFAVNCIGPVLLVKALAPLLMISAKVRTNLPGLSCSKAAIVNMTTGVASLEENSGGGNWAYRASKTALNMMSVNMKHELSPHGILIGLIHPGWVQTDMGGPSALITSEKSVSGILDVMGGLDERSNCLFHRYNGTVLPW